MSKSALEGPTKGGFGFDLCRRNEMLVKKGLKGPFFRKTGTTIVGLVLQMKKVKPKVPRQPVDASSVRRSNRVTDKPPP
ncbi:hypothetical protein ACH5RR_008702 [Cinchona calisaya]|uniref:Uncharacterized protein n=1 Tax=Cinchona calisaya TaxID=153742 RepID=A0ABD3AG07_9GENT